MARFLVVTGLVLVALGLAWPWIARLGLGHLPGDISIHGRNFTLYVPIASSILVSVVVSLFLWLINR